MYSLKFHVAWLLFAAQSAMAFHELLGSFNADINKLKSGFLKLETLLSIQRISFVRRECENISGTISKYESYANNAPCAQECSIPIIITSIVAELHIMDH